jgi:hypothetical protein
MGVLQTILANFPDKPITDADREHIRQLCVKYREERRQRRIAKLLAEVPGVKPASKMEGNDSP